MIQQAVFKEKEKSCVCSSLDDETRDECLEKDEEESNGIFYLSCGKNHMLAHYSEASCHKDAVINGLTHRYLSVHYTTLTCFTKVF